MSKNKMLMLLGGLAVVVLGVIAYLGMPAEEVEISDPPTLEQSQSLTGSLSVADRYFTVDNSVAKANAQGVSTDSNFYIFTLGPNFTNPGIDKFKDEIVLSNGAEGFVLGTYENKRWKLSPEKNYLGANLMKESELRACGTYFLIKIHHDADKSPKASFELDASYLANVTSGNDGCTAADMKLMPNEWNLISTSLSSKADFENLVGGFDEYLSVWDTFIINQTAGQAQVVGRQQANLKKFLKKDNTDLLSSYFSGNGQKDTWVYVGNVKEVNNVPTISDQTFTIDAATATTGLTVGTLVATGGDGELKYDRTGGSDAFVIGTDGKVTIGDFGKVKLQNTVDVEVSEKDTPADKDGATITVNVNLDKTVCSATKELVTKHIQDVQGALADSNNPDSAPYILSPLSQEVKDIVLVCAKFESETGVSATLIEQSDDAEAALVAAGAYTEEEVQEQQIVVEDAQVVGATEEAQTGQVAEAQVAGVSEGSVTTTETQAAIMDPMTATIQLESTTVDEGGSISGLIDSGLQDYSGNLTSNLSTVDTSISSIDANLDSNVSVNTTSDLLSLEACMNDPLGPITWVEDSTVVPSEIDSAYNNLKGYTLVALIDTLGCSELIDIQYLDPKTGGSRIAAFAPGMYEISNEEVELIDAYGMSSFSQGSIVFALDSEGVFGVFVGPDAQDVNPLSLFDGVVVTLRVTDGVFWYKDSDLNGDEYSR